MKVCYSPLSKNVSFFSLRLIVFPDLNGVLVLNVLLASLNFSTDWSEFKFFRFVNRLPFKIVLDTQLVNLGSSSWNAYGEGKSLWMWQLLWSSLAVHLSPCCLPITSCGGPRRTWPWEEHMWKVIHIPKRRADGSNSFFFNLSKKVTVLWVEIKDHKMEHQCFAFC